VKFSLQEFFFLVRSFVGIFFGVEAVQEFFLKGFTYLFSLSTDREKMAAMTM
jgi:hypothetical protein